MAGEKVCDIEVSLQSVPSLDGLAHFDDAIYKPHSVMVKIKPAVIVWLSALHNFFVCLFVSFLSHRKGERRQKLNVGMVTKRVSLLLIV